MKRTTIAVLALFIFSSLLIAATDSDYVKFGNSLYAKKDYAKAITYYDAALKINPSNSTALLYGAYSSLMLKDYSSASDKLNKACAITSNEKVCAAAAKYAKYGTGSSAAAPANASKFGISITGAYTTVGMADPNAYLSLIETSINAQKAIDPAYSGEVTKFGGAFLIGGTLGYYVMPSLLVGARIQYISLFPATVNAKDTGFTYNQETSGSLIPIMGGASYMYTFPNTQFSLGGDLFLGMGLASMTDVTTVNSKTTTLSWEGSTFVADIGARANYGFNSNFGIGLNLGFRMANVAEMTYSSVDKSTSLKVGDPVKVWKEGATEATTEAFDFGGLVAGLSLNMAF